MSSQQHVYEHHHGYHFNHTLAGLQHQKVMHRERINKLEQEHHDLEMQRSVLVREFHQYADAHDVPYRHISGYEDKTFPIESQMETARHYFWGMIGGMVIAVVLGVYFSVSTLVAQSFLMLLLGSIIVAVVIEIFASIILRALLDTRAENPHAAGKVNNTLVVVGVAFFLLLGLFAWLRFKANSPLASLLPLIMVGLELTAIIFAGACDCGYRMFRWSGTLHERHRHMLNRQAATASLLETKNLDLHELEHRIHHFEGHEEVSATAHHGENHEESTHHPHHEHEAAAHA